MMMQRPPPAQLPIKFCKIGHENPLRGTSTWAAVMCLSRRPALVGDKPRDGDQLA
jgi:hypothetical protein